MKLIPSGLMEERLLSGSAESGINPVKKDSLTVVLPRHVGMRF
jgi:hypothetical protein